MKKENGITLKDLMDLAQDKGIPDDQIYLLTSDGQPIIEIDYADECPDLWFLSDSEV